MMYQVQPFCRGCIFILLLIVCAVYRILTGSNLLFWAYIPACIWLWFYFKGLKIYITSESIIRRTGNIISHTLIIKQQNISAVNCLTVLPFLPGIIRLHYMGDSLYIFGLNGSQIKTMSDAIK
ncbi:MAG: hypothetical protein RRX95_02495 [Oscillospiraceae bacterium]